MSNILEHTRGKPKPPKLPSVFQIKFIFNTSMRKVLTPIELCCVENMGFIFMSMLLIGDIDF